MAHYSVATTKDKLSSLIDKALAGEEVVITRHGKPTVELKIVQEEKRDRAEMMELLRQHRETLPPLGITAIELKRLDQEDYER